MFGLQYISIAVVALVSVIALSPAAASTHQDCSETDAPLLCHGNRVIRSVVDQVLDSGTDVKSSIQIVPGLEIVQLPVNATTNDSDFDGRSSTAGGSNGYIERVFKYLQGHELKINLHDLLKNSDVPGAISRTFNEDDIENEIVGTSLYTFYIPTTD